MKRLVFLLLAVCLTLCACERQTGGIFYNGRELSEDEIQELISQTDSETAEEREFVSADGSMVGPTETSVFWTKGGSVYHLAASCRHLKNTQEIYYGTVEDAVSANKARACTACEKE